MATVQAKNAPIGVKFSVRVHPDLRRAIKMAAVADDQTIVERIHLMLCRELKRSDLKDQVPIPDPADSRAMTS